MDGTIRDILVMMATVSVVILAVFGVAFWANQARRDRSALIGLYLVLGIPGVLLTLYGIAQAAGREERGLLYLAIGLGLTLPLFRPVRVQVARVTPIDPASPIDMVGLCGLVAAIGFLAVSTYLDPHPDDVGGEVQTLDLAAQFIAGSLIALPIVGYSIWRSPRAVVGRLGLTWPTPKVLVVAIGALVGAFLLMIVAGMLTFAFQPDIEREINRITEDITTNVDSPIGAVLFGIGAATSEELLFRGAFQPRFGIALTALLFALVHAQYGFSFILLGVFSIGVLLGFERKYFGLTAAIITHALFNAISVLAGS